MRNFVEWNFERDKKYHLFLITQQKKNRYESGTLHLINSISSINILEHIHAHFMNRCAPKRKQLIVPKWNCAENTQSLLVMLLLLLLFLFFSLLSSQYYSHTKQKTIWMEKIEHINFKMHSFARTEIWWLLNKISLAWWLMNFVEKKNSKNLNPTK